jgi:DNA repair protein RadC
VSVHTDKGREKYGDLSLKALRLRLRERGFNAGIGGKTKDELLELLGRDDTYREEALANEESVVTWEADLGDIGHASDNALAILQSMGSIRATLIIEAEDEWTLANIVRDLQTELDDDGCGVQIPRPTRVEKTP